LRRCHRNGDLSAIRDRDIRIAAMPHAVDLSVDDVMTNVIDAADRSIARSRMHVSSKRARRTLAPR
jgi:hypothetical protein